MGRAAVLWTGGKDCALACHEASQAGHEIALLVTFIGAAGHFRAHPMSVMRDQAAAMGVPHVVITVGEPFDMAYRAAICDLRDRERIDVLVTGDITPVAGYPNWIRECARGTGVDVLTPLWGKDRTQLLEQVLRAGFHAIFSCVKRPWLSPDWVGRELTADAINELKQLSVATGMDISGEQGEYHTLTIGGPVFRRPLDLSPQQWVRRDDGDLTYLEPVS